MKRKSELLRYLEFFKKELVDNLLFFWMKGCLDEKCGGYFNCYTNDGSRLISTDKYTWSQGRFLWIFSRLAMLKSDVFDEEQRVHFLSYAERGKDFLRRNVLLGEGDFRCAFLIDADGKHKTVDGHEGYDLSISADCFVVMGFAAYARAAEDASAWSFAKSLAESVYERYESGDYRSLPYPVPEWYISHAKPMILTNLFCELYRAAEIFEPEYAEVIRPRLLKCHEEVFEVFRDGEGLVHEFKLSDGSFAQNLFGQHINPGHTLEDMWFQLEAAQILGIDRYKERIKETVIKTMELGWDNEYGGLYHFAPCGGFDAEYEIGDTEGNPQLRLVLDDFGSKLWWVHSEALYTTLLMYCNTCDEQYFDLFKKVFDYTFATFPNPDRSIREWIQIRTREGKPQDKVVALPVKDPYHIIRNVLLIIELLEKVRDA